MRAPEPIKLFKGLKFRSVHFRMNAEVSSVRPEVNEVDVILDSGDGHGWQETWNLEHVKAGFERNEYWALEKPEGEIILY